VFTWQLWNFIQTNSDPLNLKESTFTIQKSLNTQNRLKKKNSEQLP